MATSTAHSSKEAKNTYGLPQGEPLRRELVRWFRLQRNAVLAWAKRTGGAGKLPSFDSLGLGSRPMAARMAPKLAPIYEDAYERFLAELPQRPKPKPVMATKEHHYNPDQPRVPAGSPDGGEWGAGGGSREKPAAAKPPKDLSAITDAQEKFNALNAFTKEHVAKVTAKEGHALRAYKTDKVFVEANDALRRGQLGDAKTAAQIKLLDSSIAANTIKEPVIVYRGIGNSEQIGLAGGGVGSVLHDSAFMSTSLDSDVATRFSQRMSVAGEASVLKITLPEGHNAVMPDTAVAKHDFYTDLLGYNPKSKFSGEREVLLGRGTNLKITGYGGKVNGVHVYHAEPA